MSPLDRALALAAGEDEHAVEALGAGSRGNAGPPLGELVLGPAERATGQTGETETPA